MKNRTARTAAATLALFATAALVGCGSTEETASNDSNAQFNIDLTETNTQFTQKSTRVWREPVKPEPIQVNWSNRSREELLRLTQVKERRDDY